MKIATASLDLPPAELPDPRDVTSAYYHNLSAF